MITKLYAVDFDGTLCDSPLPDQGKKIYKEKTKADYPHIGWWSKLESLDMNIFDIKLFPTTVGIIRNANADSNSVVTILTSRLPKFEPIIRNILHNNNILVDGVITKNSQMSKGDVLLRLSEKYPDLLEINMYDDDLENQHLASIKRVINQFRPNIIINFYKSHNGNFTLTYSNKIDHLIKEEINNLNSIYIK